MQVQSITSTGMYSQTSKNAFYEFFWHSETKKVSSKIPQTPLKYIYFWYQKLSKTPNPNPFNIFFCDTKGCRYLFLWSPPPLWFIENFPPDNWSPPEIFRHNQNFSQTKTFMQNHDTPLLYIKFFNTKNLQKHQRVPLRFFSLVGQKKFDYFLWHGLLKILHPTDGQLRLLAVLSLFKLVIARTRN